jgi:hypothetical protein
MGMDAMVLCLALDTRVAVVGSISTWGLQMMNAWMVVGVEFHGNQGLRCEITWANCACGEWRSCCIPRPEAGCGDPSGSGVGFLQPCKRMAAEGSFF